LATVIDELVIQIAFDVKQMREEKVVEDRLKKLREEAERTGKDMETSGKRAAQFFSAAKVEALALMSVLAGGAGLISSINSTASSIAGLGRAATSLNNMNPQALDAWGMALKRIGGNAEDAVTSFNNIGQALANYRLRGDTTIIPFLNAIGAQATMTPEQIALKFAEYIKAHPEKTNQEIKVLGQGLGMTQSMTNLLRQGPEAVAKELALSKELGLRTQEMIDVATKFNHDFTALAEAASHLKDRFETALMPTIDKVILWLTRFTIDHPDEATGLGIGGAAIGGLAGSSVIARMLGLSSLADAFGSLTLMVTRLAGVFGLLTGLSGDSPTTEQQKRNEEEYRRQHGLGPAPSGGTLNNLWKKWFGGGSATPTADPSGGQTTGIDPAVRARAQAVHDEFVKQGTDDQTAWALAANAVQESQADPNSKPGDMGRAHGLFMWRDDEASGARALQFQKMFGHMPEQGTLSEAVAFARWELANTEKDAAAHIAQAQGVGGKAAAASRWWLRPKDVEAEQARRARIGNSLAPGPRAGNAPASPPPAGAYIPDPGLLPPPGARGEGAGSTSTHSSSSSLDIGQINIHTAATDSRSIAKEIHGAISDHMIAQSNIRLV